MKISTLTLGACLMLTALGLHAQLIAPQKKEWDVQFTNGIAAQVEDKIITLEELRKEVTPLIPQIRMNSRTRTDFDKNIAVVTREILQNLVDRILIIRDFYDKGAHIPDTYLQKEFDDYITKEFNGDRSAFLEFLRLQGKSEMDFRDELKDDIIVSYMRMQSLPSQTAVSPRKIEEYYQKNKSRYFEEEGVNLGLIMLVPIADENPDLLNQTANEIVQKLEAGESFSELAKTYSQDDKRDEGGDWGWISRDDLIPALAEQAFALEEGQHSQPIAVGDYIYILEVKEKRTAGIKELEKVRGEIEQEITAQLSRQAQQRWIERLRKNAYIKYFLKEAGGMKSSPGTMQMKLGANESDS
ncbi:peptidyl-prolyl cis-trans isomerase [Ruficoccus amylovorans]|uniref:Peptidyl-prolyl cis-trans isomerase n=1 Tax=Ruficoccus amylovorans TaxID=1804625 RepID=A0A842HDG7_9BACT|nr:peptidyl-prolyl cis-trans isomerase [Ruficoccus amylovorans]MBC2594260.1 peptidyl-prolyl cis-trans isomerase [Ruficoccus amylovorans]